MTSSSPGLSMSSESSANYQLGVLLVMGASMMSGLSAALTQKALSQGTPRHALFFSAELGVYGILFLLGRDLYSGNVKSTELFSGLVANWDLYSLIPVLVNVCQQIFLRFLFSQ